MGQVREHQRDGLTPTAEGALVVGDASFAGQLRNQMWWNQVAELAEDGVVGDGWNGLGLLFHPRLVAGRNHSFQPFLPILMRCQWVQSVVFVQSRAGGGNNFHSSTYSNDAKQTEH
jgi:hypothetical protein